MDTTSSRLAVNDIINNAPALAGAILNIGGNK